MEVEIIKYVFSAKVYQYSSSKDMVGWTIVSLPKEIEIRNNFKQLEEGLGRMKVTAEIGYTKQDTYLLPLKAEIIKKENIALDKNMKIIILI